MKRNIANKVVALLCVIFLAFGCKVRKEAKPVVVTAPAKEINNKTRAIEKIQANSFEFNTLSAKSKIDFKMNANSNGASMNLRIQNKEVIWASITAFAGIQVARVMITPDSIKVLNFFQGEYTAKPFNYIYRYANRQINFKALQDLFIGNAIPGSVNESSLFKIVNNETQVNSELGGILYKLILNQDSKVLENTLQDEKGQQLTARYDDFQQVNGRQLPYSINLISNATNRKIQIDIKYSSVSINEPLNFPFSVPKRFTVKD